MLSPAGPESRILMLRGTAGGRPGSSEPREPPLLAEPSIPNSEPLDHNTPAGGAAAQPRRPSVFPARLMTASVRTQHGWEPIDAVDFVHAEEELQIIWTDSGEPPC